MRSVEDIKQQLRDYKKSFYKRQLFAGAVYFTLTIIGFFVLASLIEHFLWMNTWGRSFVFYGLSLVILLAFVFFILKSLYTLVRSDSTLTHEQAARDISRYFPEIEDTLLNILQLDRSTTVEEKSLTGAAIKQKTKKIAKFQFSHAIRYDKLKKYGAFLLMAFVSILILSYVQPDMMVESPKRIIQHSQEFEKPSPFSFHIIEANPLAFKGEAYTFSFKIDGRFQPDEVLLYKDENEIPVTNTSKDGIYTHTFDAFSTSTTIRIAASGFYSKPFYVDVVDRPELSNMHIALKPPAYTGQKAQTLTSTGHIAAPEGSVAEWYLQATVADSAKWLFEDTMLVSSALHDGSFYFNKTLYESQPYEIQFQNRYGKNKFLLKYTIDVVKDAQPQIEAVTIIDSTNFKYVILMGSIQDDYGFSKLRIGYKTVKQAKHQYIPLKINRSLPAQRFYTNWKIEELDLKAGEELRYFVEVGDNDAVNGVKYARSSNFTFNIPSLKELDSLAEKRSEIVNNQLKNAGSKSKQLASQLDDIKNRLKTQKEVNWQEQKLLDAALRDRKKLEELISKLGNEYNAFKKTLNDAQKNGAQAKQQQKQMQELFNDLMDDKTKKMYEKLKELLEKKSSPEEISKQMEQISNREQNQARNLKRLQELFKRMQVEDKLTKNAQKLDSLARSQNTVEADDLEKQKSIEEQFADFRREMSAIKDMNQSLEKPQALEDFELEEKQISETLDEIAELQEQQKQSESNTESQQNDSDQRKSSINKKQKQAASQMQNLSQKMSKMQEGMQAETIQINLDQLRNILDDLIKLSFKQEDIIANMREVMQSDPRFLELSQRQLQLQDDGKVIQDSLLSLASRAVQISSYVTREIDLVNDHLSTSLQHLKDRNRSKALGSQQLTMTSMNNLALLLTNTMEQMQLNLSMAQGKGKSSKKPNKGLSDLQKQQNQLGQKIEGLKQSGKKGRELSQELARLAAEQEAIRRQVQQIKEALDGKPGGKGAGDQLKKALQMMEQSEIDLVNKRLTEQLQYRQKQIKTRLLEAERSQREQGNDEKREAAKPSVLSRRIPPELKEYIKEKEGTVETLQTIPLDLSPFYRKEVNNYFRRLSIDSE